MIYRHIEPHLSDYMGKVFEEICKQYLWKQLLSGECPVEFSSLGRWWGNDPTEKRQTEIDILAEQDKNTALFGECKWTNEKVDLGVLETLVKRSELFPYKNVHYYLFAKTGFTKGCTDRASEMRNVTLGGLTDLICGLLGLRAAKRHGGSTVAVVFGVIAVIPGGVCSAYLSLRYT